MEIIGKDYIVFWNIIKEKYILAVKKISQSNEQLFNSVGSDILYSNNLKDLTTQTKEGQPMLAAQICQMAEGHSSKL